MGVPHGYDLGLFERLNDEYRARRVVPKPQPQTDAGYIGTAERQLAGVRRHLELEGKDVLELGCGHGWLSTLLTSRAGAATAVGVDVKESSVWDRHRSSRVSFTVGDMSRETVTPAESVDAVVSAVALEHVRRPLQMLAALHRALRPRGRACLRFNLYRGPKASHVYRHVFFPWPHLLFDERVCVAYYEKHHGRRLTFSWVNKLTIAEYLHIAREAGFRIDAVELTPTPIDLPFFLRFEQLLGRYPALDLETDFMTMVLTRGPSVDETVPAVGYLERQLRFDREVAEARRSIEKRA